MGCPNSRSWRYNENNNPDCINSRKKVLVVGPSFCGKSSLIARLCEPKECLNEEYIPTTSVMTTNHLLDQQPYLLFELGGESTQWTAYYEDTQGVIIVLDPGL